MGRLRRLAYSNDFRGDRVVMAVTALLAGRMGADRFVVATTTWTALTALVIAGAIAPLGDRPAHRTRFWGPG